MFHQVRHGQGRSKRGYSLLELIAVVVIMAAVLSIVMGGYKTMIAKARLAQTVSEMMALAQASLDFYNSQGKWPAAPSDLAPAFMYANIASSPFNDNYQIHGLNNAVTISTDVPSGLANHYYQGTLLQILPGAAFDTIAITQEMPNELSGRLAYDKKYVYKQ